VFTLSEGFDDEREVKKADEQNVEFLEAREDATEAFQSAEEPLDFIAFAVYGFVVLTWFQTVALGRHYRNKAEIQGQLPGLVVLAGAVHNQMQRRVQRPQARQQLTTSLGVGGLAGRQRKGFSSLSKVGRQSYCKSLCVFMLRTNVTALMDRPNILT